MASSLPSLHLYDSHNLNQNFSDIVKRYLKIKGMTQSDLVRTSELPKTTISRICRNTNDKGSSYKPDMHTFMSVSLGLKLTPDEAQELFFTAFPELSFMGGFLNGKLTIQQANEILYDNGYSLLGNVKEE